MPETLTEWDARDRALKYASGRISTLEKEIRDIKREWISSDKRKDRKIEALQSALAAREGAPE